MVTKAQRRRQLARAKWERQQQRRAQRVRRARTRRAIVACAVLAVLAGGGVALATTGVFGGDDDAEPSTAASDDAEPSPPPEDPCEEPAAGEPSGETWESAPELTVDTAAAHTLLLETTCGDISIALDAEAAPHTVNSLSFLAGEGYFDHTRCHRLVTDGPHVLQCGDPEGTGQGDPGYTLPDENLDAPEIADGVYPAGTVAMANRYNAAEDTGRDSGGSQFFLVHQDTELPPDFTPFGTVEEGMDVLERIVEAGSQPDPATGNTAPNATVVIDRATVTSE